MTRHISRYCILLGRATKAALKHQPWKAFIIGLHFERWHARQEWSYE